MPNTRIMEAYRNYVAENNRRATETVSRSAGFYADEVAWGDRGLEGVKLDALMPHM